MQVTKIGHCCMIIEEAGSKILTDPGVWSDLSQVNLSDINAVLITHEHADHYDPEAIKNIVSQNPKVKFISNTSVSKLLKQLGFNCNFLEEGQNTLLGQIKVEAFGNEHAKIYKDFGKVQNTGFMLADKLFYPGDAFTLLDRPITTLALPVCAPWLHIKESINYALAVKPKQAFPVHDGMLKFPGAFHSLPKKIMEENNINFIVPELNKPFTI